MIIYIIFIVYNQCLTRIVHINLMNIRYLIVAFVCLASCTTNEVVQDPVKLSNLDEKYGFNGIRFESSPEQIEGLVPVAESEFSQLYEKENEVRRIGEIWVLSIDYNFIKRKLHRVTVRTRNGLDTGSLMASFKEAYGQPKAHEIGNDSIFIWESEKVLLRVKKDIKGNRFKEIETSTKVFDKEIKDYYASKATKEKSELQNAF